MQKQVLYMQGWKQGTYKGHKQTTIRYCKPTEHAPEGSVARVASDVSCRPDNSILPSDPDILSFITFHINTYFKELFDHSFTSASPDEQQR